MSITTKIVFKPTDSATTKSGVPRWRGFTFEECRGKIASKEWQQTLKGEKFSPKMVITEAEGEGENAKVLAFTVKWPVEYVVHKDTDASLSEMTKWVKERGASDKWVAEAIGKYWNIAPTTLPQSQGRMSVAEQVVAWKKEGLTDEQIVARLSA